MIKVSGADPNFGQNKVDEARQRERVSARTSGKADSSSGGAKTSETVAVSTVAREVGKINAQVKSTPDVRREKVQAIKEKIERGEYSVSSDEIAGKMIADIVRRSE